MVKSAVELELLIDFVLDGKPVAVPAEAATHVESVLTGIASANVLCS